MYMSTVGPVFRRGVLQTIVAAFLIFLQGCVELLPGHGDEYEDTAVLVINNLTDKDVQFDITVRGPNKEVLYDALFLVEAGKGHQTEPFDDVVRTVEYELSSGDHGIVNIPTSPNTDRHPRRKLWISYTTEDGIVYRQR
ncbi:hypothetical protein RBH26_21065 [Natronolimnohabitans sp. A-GB9]|uniref:hypothetical protein n=1 Tax=Natronolimnohabitans sp. A-GB9 TaxID=3069757 RepID=UPI0027B5E0F0|nr:hypothetical protein [Natronolimnohabitans sp. A-GB9]MDQ2052936.1 hypothetical protein [Natronolimnohabitans sp. A-GB9]